MGTELKGQKCPVCSESELTLGEEELEVPHFGLTYIFSMACGACGYRKTDVESAEQNPAARFSLDVESDDDLNIRVVKSGEATLKIPHIISMEPGPSSEGFITNVEGVLTRVKAVLESSMEAEEEPDKKKKLKNMIKKLSRALVGREKIKIIIEDKTGNSAIISDKASKSRI